MHSFMLSPHGCGWHIERSAFDSMLLAAAERAGADVIRGALPEVESTFVVDATGRSAHVARQLGISRVHTDHMIAVVGILQRTAVSACTGTSLVEATECGYWYCAPLPGDRLVCAHLTDHSCGTSYGRRPATPGMLA